MEKAEWLVCVSAGRKWAIRRAGRVDLEASDFYSKKVDPGPFVYQTDPAPTLLLGKPPKETTKLTSSSA